MKRTLFCSLAIALSSVGMAKADFLPPGCDDCQMLLLTHHQAYIHKFLVTPGRRYDVMLFRDSSYGDADLYTHPTSNLSLTTYTCAPKLDGEAMERCSFTATTNEYYAMVYAYQGSVEATLYVVESSAYHNGLAPGHLDYCSTTNVCGWAGADCDSDAECAEGLVCVPDVGAEHGFASYIDVCRGG